MVGLANLPWLLPTRLVGGLNLAPRHAPSLFIECSNNSGTLVGEYSRLRRTRVHHEIASPMKSLNGASFRLGSWFAKRSQQKEARGGECGPHAFRRLSPSGIYPVTDRNAA